MIEIWILSSRMFKIAQVENHSGLNIDVWSRSSDDEIKIIGNRDGCIPEKYEKERLYDITNSFETVVEGIRWKGIIWYGQLNRMLERKWPKQLFQWIPFERNKRGRYRRSWKKEMQKAIQRRDWCEETLEIEKNGKSE